MEKGKIARFKVLLICGSAGSVEVLMRVLPQLAAFPTVAIVIVLHRKNTEDSALEELIGLKTIVPVKEVEDKVPMLPGFIYIAPSDYHLLFEKNGALSLDISEKVNYSRPSIDVSLESAAEAYGPGVAALLLSGANNDGTAGLKSVKTKGGITAVQNPEDAEIPFMPKNAMENADPDYVLQTDAIANFINLINL